MEQGPFVWKYGLACLLQLLVGISPWGQDEGNPWFPKRESAEPILRALEQVLAIRQLTPLFLDSARLLGDKFYRLKNDWRCFPFSLNKIKSPQLNFHPPTPLCCRLTKANQDTPNVPASPSRSSQPIQVADASKCLVKRDAENAAFEKVVQQKHIV